MKFLLGLVLIFATQARAEVWPTQNQWSDTWENSYSTWVSTRLNEDFFKTAPYVFKMNCADFVYVARAVFAYENNLEFAINDGAGIFSSRTTRFDDVKDPTRRMQKFIEKVMEIGSIRTLARDSFLVSTKDIRAGDFLLAAPARIHSWIIWKIDEFTNPLLLYASEPADTWLFEAYGYPSTSEFFEGANHPGDGGSALDVFAGPKN